MSELSGSFKLAWDEFETTAGNSFRELWEEQHFTNVTLVCDDEKQIKAHKVVLSSSSAFFKRILTKNLHEHPLIYLKGIAFAELENIVQFIYQGQTEVRQSNLNRFLNAAKDLEVKGLMNHSFIKEENSQEMLGHHLEVNDESTESNNDLAVGLTSDKEFCDAIKVESPEGFSEGKPALEERVLKYLCDQCERKFNTRSGLWLHKKKIHEGVTHNCEQCKQTFSQTSHLKRHKKSVHIIL